MKWLAENHTKRAAGLLEYIPVYGRYDDWFYLLDTPLRTNIAQLTMSQLTLDMLSQKNAVSLLAKWCPSENASSPITKRRAKTLIKLLGISAKQYRQMLSKLRTKINVLEKLMSANEWDKIEFDKIPSKAGLKYKNAFARRDIIAKKYEAFAKDKKTKVNAGTLYPYEVVQKAISYFHEYRYRDNDIHETDRAMINKYWENLPDYLEGKDCSIMCVVDTSASMWGTPINVAISLGLYCAERIGGDFRNHYISFSRHPRLIKTEGVDFVDKVERIYKTNLCENTNLTGVFDLLLNNALKPNVNINDIPKTIVVISDMEIDYGTVGSSWSRSKVTTEMEQIREKWARHGLELPRLVYWNVDARQNNILDAGPNVSFISGFSPIIFKQVITGKTGYDLMLETLLNERYEIIK